MKTPTAPELTAAAKLVHVHARTTKRVDGMAETVRTDPSIRALIDAVLLHAGPEVTTASLIDAVFLTGLELGLNVGAARWRNP